MAEFHEAYWVTVGTAGPVLFVASVVALAQSAQAMVRSMDAQAGRPREPLMVRRAVWRVFPRFSPIGTSFAWAAVSMLADTVIFTQALIHLSDESDSGRSWVTLACSLAVISLAAQTTAAMKASLQIRSQELETKLAALERTYARITPPSGDGAPPASAGSAAPAGTPPAAARRRPRPR